MYEYNGNLISSRDKIKNKKNVVYRNVPKYLLIYPDEGEILIFMDCEDIIVCKELPKTLISLHIVNTKYDYLDITRFPDLKHLYIYEDKDICHTGISGLEKCNLETLFISSKTLKIPLSVLENKEIKNITLNCEIYSDHKINVSNSVKNINIRDEVKNISLEDCHLNNLNLNINSKKDIYDIIDQVKNQKNINMTIQKYSSNYPYYKEYKVKNRNNETKYKISTYD